MPSAFENLCGPGKPLKAEAPDAKEFAGLKRSGLARLKDAATPALSLESRFDLLAAWWQPSCRRSRPRAIRERCAAGASRGT